MNSPNPMRAELGFYPFEDVRWAFDKLWSATISRAQWLPARLQWTGNPQELWLSDDLVLSQTCGWPLITRLTDKVRVVGTFRHTTPESAAHHYRSVILGRTDGTPFDFQESIAAVNSTESLSGWISLIAAIHGPQETWRGEVRMTGSHLESVRMLHRGEADIASIDSVTLAHLKRLFPELISSLFVICNGPMVPCLPLITHRSINDTQLDELRNALKEATRDASIAGATEALFISGFDELELDDYLPLRNLSLIY
ncbi:MAG: PhnD/SsuA/transferrin family substrate-binding protein [Acidimicrobiaceae bacterium]|nr:PhnD/SsuA/transferrin family substrate-binding protein [Acidimicrobiaceae bacterium]